LKSAFNDWEHDQKEFSGALILGKAHKVANWLLSY
jgi:hypothetical protein